MLKYYSALLISLLPSFIYAQNNTFPASGNVGIGTTTPGYKLSLDLGATRSGIIINSDGDASTYSDLVFGVKTIAGVPTGNVAQWILSHRKDGYFSGGGSAVSSLEFYGSRAGGGYYTPLVFKTDGDIILASPYQTARSGNVGIGIVSPVAKLDVKGNARISDGLQIINLVSGSNTSGYALSVGLNDDGVNFSNSSTVRGFKFNNANGNLVTVTSTGNVGIGVTPPSAYKLAVSGTIGARRVKVTQEAWADFVFQPDYQLPSLQEVERFIKINKHLPDMPSEKEVVENGLDVGEMNRKLLQKVEEMMLYMIELKKEIEMLKSETSKDSNISK